MGYWMTLHQLGTLTSFAEVGLQNTEEKGRDTSEWQWAGGLGEIGL